MNARTLLPMDVFTAPFTSLAMARYERVPYDYNKDVSDTDSNGKNNVVKWEHIMDETRKIPADLNYGAVKLDGDYHAVENRVMLFGQRYDGSVKYGAEITGGYNASTTNTGEIYLKNQE